MSINAEKYYFDVTTNSLIDGSNNIISNTELYPHIYLGENGSLINIQICQNQDVTDKYTDIPSNAVAQAIVDVDYSNPINYNLVKDDENEWTVSGVAEEFYYTEGLSAEPLHVYINGSLATQGTVGSLSAGEWGWSANTVYVRLSDDSDPDTKASGYVTYMPTYTPVYMQSLSDKFNQVLTWDDAGIFRDPVLANGEITFYLYANTDDFVERLGSSSEASNSQMQIQFMEAVTTNLFNVFSFKFRCLNRFLPNTFSPTATPASYYTITQADAAFVNQGKFNLSTAVDTQLASGVMTRSSSIHKIEPETGTTDDLVTISGGVSGYNMLIYADDPADVITIKHGTGNILTPDDIDFDLTGSTVLMLTYDGTNWRMLSAMDTTQYVAKQLFDANTILAADSDNTPAALTIPEQTLVGRITSGNIDALTVSEVKTLIDLTSTSDVAFGNIDSGSSGSAGSLDVFPTTASKGKLTISATDNTGDTAVTITNAAHGQATDVTIPDSGLATSYVAQSTAALSVAEVDVLDGAVIGTQTASKVVIADPNVNTGVSKVTELHIGSTGAETQVTATAAELNYNDITAAGTAEASKALILDASKDIASINDISCAGVTTSDVTASRAVVSSAGNKLEASATTATELGYVSGVTSSIQTQINNISITADNTTMDMIDTPTYDDVQDWSNGTQSAGIIDGGLITANAGYGGNEATTVLLVHGDGIDASTTFTDASAGGSTHTLLANGDAQVDTAQKVWGTGSILFDGTVDSVSTNDNLTDFNFGSGDFAIDMRVRFSATSGTQMLCQQWAVGDKSFQFYNNSTNSTLDFAYSTDGTSAAATAQWAWTPSTDTWYHVAIARDGVNLRAYIDGTQLGATHNIGASILYASTDEFYIGGAGMTGWIDEIRIEKAANHSWTGATITVPTAAYSITGTVDVSALKGIIKTTDSAIGANEFFDLAASTDNALTDSDANYIAVDYNSGTPQLLIGVTNTANGHTIFNLGKVYREGSDLDIISSGLRIYDLSKRIQQRNVETYGWQFVDGATVGETGTRNISVSAGVLYAGYNRIITPSFDSVGGAETFKYYYYTGAAWTASDQSAIDNTQYNNIATGLATLANNKYGVHWVYKGTNGNVYVIYGQGSYTLSEAQLVQPPASLPDLVSEMGVLRAKIIILKNAASFTETDNLNDVTFTSSTVANHNDLANIDGGTAGEYYHMTSSEHTELSGWVDNITLSTDGSIAQESGATITTDQINAVDGDGLKLYDDAGNGIFVEDGGNVGIAKANPDALLHVYNSAGIFNHFESDQLSYKVQSGQPFSGAFYTCRVGTTTADQVALVCNGTTSYVICHTNGNVGVGVTAPASKLTVAGEIAPGTDDSFDLGNVSYRWDDIYATNGTIQTSDERYKRDITNIENISLFLEKLRPVFFKWKDYHKDAVIEEWTDDEGEFHSVEQQPEINKTHTRQHCGLIAQEVEKVLVELGIDNNDFAALCYNEDIDRYSVRYTELIPILIKGWQEQQTVINSQQAKLDDLEARLAALEAKQ